jgi:hypothetical protein
MEALMEKSVLPSPDDKDYCFSYDSSKFHCLYVCQKDIDLTAAASLSHIADQDLLYLTFDGLLAKISARATQGVDSGRCADMLQSTE